MVDNNDNNNVKDNKDNTLPHQVQTGSITDSVSLPTAKEMLNLIPNIAAPQDSILGHLCVPLCSLDLEMHMMLNTDHLGFWAQAVWSQEYFQAALKSAAPLIPAALPCLFCLNARDREPLVVHSFVIAVVQSKLTLVALPISTLPLLYPPALLMFGPDKLLTSISFTLPAAEANDNFIPSRELLAP